MVEAVLGASMNASRQPVAPSVSPSCWLVSPYHPRFTRRKNQSHAHPRTFFKNVVIRPSLLHGNLCASNWGGDSVGESVLFGQSCHIGHADVAIAMVTMMGPPSKGMPRSPVVRIGDGRVVVMRRTIFCAVCVSRASKYSRKFHACHQLRMDERSGL